MNIRRKRQEALTEIIKKDPVSTQEELIKKLRDRGYDVTQATVSRDIKELKLVKVTDALGRSAYAQVSDDVGAFASKYKNILIESARAVDYAGNICTLKCFPGMAGAACAAVDSMKWDGLVGTLAGDDTIFVLCRTEAKAEKLRDIISDTISGNNAE
jgi:transcriptional regulator of arginine metabolism